MEALLTELNNAIEMLAPKDPFIEEKKTPEGIIIQQSSSLSAASSGVTGPMSEKQKVRLLMEKKRQRENEKDKEAQRKTSNLIKQGEYFPKALHTVSLLSIYFTLWTILTLIVWLSRGKLWCVDRYVRENDENWTSKQSAACVKSGKSINTFSDKYGEN